MRKIIIQTRLIDDYCIKAAKDMNFDAFYKKDLSFRKELGLPPFKHIINIIIRGKKEDAVFNHANSLFSMLKEKSPSGIELYEPHPDVVPKLRDKYRFTIMIKAKNVIKALLSIKPIVKEFKKKNVIITINVDP